jgi:HD domain-containing protein
VATTSSRAVYRSRQVFHAIWPRIAAPDLESARRILTAPQWRLFEAMQRRDQRHALEVMRRLRAQTDERDLLIAALLHDCGKGDVPVWLRVLHVVMPAFGRLTGKEGARGWRGAAWRLEHHEALTVRLVQSAGSSDRTVRFVAGACTPEEAWMAALLLAADDAS